MFLRLRQLCLVAAELEPVLEDLIEVFGTVVCHRDPGVGQFGLHNALLPFGPGFIEVVAPLKADTAAGRYLTRRGGDGGYMVILDSEGLQRWRDHCAQIVVRIAAGLKHDPYEGLQLHPKDTGGALLEINHTRGNSTDPWGPYWPAGPHWQDASKRERGIVAATLQSDDPARLAGRWGEILQRRAQRQDEAWRIELDLGELLFVEARDGRGEGLQGITLHLPDARSVRARAKARKCLQPDGNIRIGGVLFSLA